MLNYLFRRFLYMLLTVALLSVTVFAVVQLPAGDYVDSLVVRMVQQGTAVDQITLDNLRHRFGLDQPMYIQYLRWIWNFINGDLGYSFTFSQPVAWAIADRVILTATIAFSTIIFTYLVAIPIGIYSATHQYTFADYFFTLGGLIGVSTPNFLLALILTLIFIRADLGVGGLFSPEYLRASWSFARVVDLLKHLPLPMVIIGLSGTAWLMRVMRATLLDELSKQYVVTARAKGVNELKLLFKYPVRVALNPIISTIGGALPYIISGGVIVELVLNLPTVGPMLYLAIVSEDIYLASSLLLILGILTVTGTLISDILLVVMDPRIRFNSRED